MKSKDVVGNLLAAAFMTALFVMSGSASASDISLHKDSKSYRVYLGVIPASMLKKEPQLVDGDKSLHGGIGNQASGAQHIMVAIYRAADNRRVTDATVIASVKPDKLLKRDKTVKPLEKMLTSGAVTYGNFFKVDGKGEYEIKVDIYSPNQNGAEQVEFNYEF